MNTFKNFLLKIKNFFIFYVTPSIFFHSIFLDEQIDYIMKNANSVYYDNKKYWIIAELENGSYYAIWNENYPYAWLSVLLFSYKKYEENKEYLFITSPKFEELYYQIMPSRKKMLEFKNWLTKNIVED